MSHDPRFFPPQPPIPVQPIAYRAYTRQSKPGILTAVGILSIVLACVSFAAGIGGALMALGFAVMSTRAMLPPPPAPAPVSSVIVSGNAIVSPDEALPRGTSLLIANILARKRDMSDRQIEQLKALLGQAGKR